MSTQMIKPELHYYDIAKDVIAFSSTRHSGVSKGNYEAFNINLYCGDEPANIQANRNALATYLGLEVNRLIVPHQVHGIESRMIAAEFFNLPEDIRNRILDGVDAVMTNEPNVCIGVSTADCIPVLIYDAEHHAAAAVHAGWRGTLGHIVMKTVKEMALNFHSDPTKLKAVIGPGISLAHFEVGQEVYEQFANANFDMERLAKLYPVSTPKEGEPPMKWHIDLKLSNRMDLEQMGVDSQNIIDEGICTYASATEYFSARRLGINSGRIYNGIILNPNRSLE